MRYRSLLGSVLAAAAFFDVPSSEAQSLPTDVRGSWMLGLGAQVDEEESESLLATMYVGVGPRTWLTFSGGQSSSPVERADIEADTWAIGVDHKFDTIGFTFEAVRWGDPNALETDDLAASVYLERARWRVGVGYETRDLEIPFTLTGPLGGTIRRDAQAAADNLSVDARVAVAERWRLHFGITEHDYERDLNVLPRIQTLNLLSTSTLTLANSFLDHERYFAVEREIGRVVLNVRATTDSSAIDDSKFETLEAAALFPIGGRVDLEVNVGSGRSEFFDSGLYGGLLFLVYGR